MPYIFITLSLLITMSMTSANDFTYVSPQSNVLQEGPKIIKLRTKNNTDIDILFNHKGQLEVAEGVNLNRGDIFIPGQGMLSLSEIERRMLSLGERIYGKWRLVKYQEYGWVYKVNAAGKGRPIFHLVNAYSGQLIGSMTQLDPLPLESQVAKD